MNQFQQLLSARGVIRHSGQALWKYALDDVGFYALKTTLAAAIDKDVLEPVDCALYYAEWWRRTYEGGIPSKRAIHESVGNHLGYSEEEFYDQARKGGQVLGLRWISNQYTMYFRTLLLQGGLPVKHMTRHRGAYKNFLLRILELNPTSVNDFAFNPSITADLPASSRSAEIYECCLAIVRAILDNENDDNEYLSILSNNRELAEIETELQIRKRSMRSMPRKAHTKVTWMYHPASGKIRLYLGFPELTSEQFSSLFSKVNAEALDYEYKLYYNDLLVCRFIRKVNGNYRTDWVNQDELLWDGTDQLPELYLTAYDGERFGCNDLIGHLPTTAHPTLWSVYDDIQFTLEKGRHTNGETGYVLCPPDSNLDGDFQLATMMLAGQSMQWVAYRGILTVDAFEFRSASKKIEWYIVDERPKWIKRANYPIFHRKPRVFAEDESGAQTGRLDLQWRQSSAQPWINWNEPIPAGLTEIRIQSGDIVEHDYCFNIGNLAAKCSSEELHAAQISLLNNTFHFQIFEDALVAITKEDSNTIQLKLRTTTGIPTALKCNLRLPNQTRSLLFEMAPPFHGVALIDNAGQIMPPNTSLTVHKLRGYRLMTNSDGLVINMTNTAVRGIIISEPLHPGLSALIKFEDKIAQLFPALFKKMCALDIYSDINPKPSLNATPRFKYRDFINPIMLKALIQLPGGYGADWLNYFIIPYLGVMLTENEAKGLFKNLEDARLKMSSAIILNAKGLIVQELLEKQGIDFFEFVTVFNDEIMMRRGHLIHKLKAKDTTGRWAYYFVYVSQAKENSFLKSIEGDGTIDLEDYGKVVASCYGEEPTEEVKDYLKEKYGFSV